MYKLRIEDSFDSAHQLAGYQGKCARIHGHTWKVEAIFQFDKLNDIGLSYDFKDLKVGLHGVCDWLDHKFLNDLILQPTAEHIAKKIYEELKDLANYPTPIKIRVWESPRAYCEYEDK